jgi:hypothetical protein
MSTANWARRLSERESDILEIVMRSLRDCVGVSSYLTYFASRLRRALPVTRQKMEWEKVSGYSLGSDLTKARA